MITGASNCRLYPRRSVQARCMLALTHKQIQGRRRITLRPLSAAFAVIVTSPARRPCIGTATTSSVQRPTRRQVQTTKPRQRLTHCRPGQMEFLDLVSNPFIQRRIAWRPAFQHARLLQKPGETSLLSRSMTSLYTGLNRSMPSSNVLALAVSWSGLPSRGRRRHRPPAYIL
ncbi:hypothetical protein PBRA_009711 [Plasmodiophora brassicae]|nr:hypothetical protein PBRA_009711 [Plasmodiophora brassicae]